MPALRSPQSLEPGLAGPGPSAGMGYGGRLRDADGLPAQGGGDQTASTQILYRWSLLLGVSVAGLAFLPLDCSRARLLANNALARPGVALAPPSGFASTPDRRYVFFNALRDGGTCALVERRKDGGTVLT